MSQRVAPAVLVASAEAGSVGLGGVDMKKLGMCVLLALALGLAACSDSDQTPATGGPGGTAGQSGSGGSGGAGATGGGAGAAGTGGAAGMGGTSRR